MLHDGPDHLRWTAGWSSKVGGSVCSMRFQPRSFRHALEGRVPGGLRGIRARAQDRPVSHATPQQVTGRCRCGQSRRRPKWRAC
jgi:hypothetical protein